MRNIQSYFNKVKAGYPNLGDYIVMTRAIRGRGFSKKVVTKWFNRLIPKDDYESSDKKYLLNELVKINLDPSWKHDSEDNLGKVERKPINMKITLYERKTTN